MVRQKANAELVPRVVPRQERARQTVETILDAAGHLLDEVGMDGFNTNLLARRAGVRVRSVYRYFPNKMAVVVALAERMTAEWDSWFDGFRWLADPDVDWRRGWRVSVRRFYGGVRALPGGAAVRRAMQSVPELRAIDQEDNRRLATQIGRALRARGAHLSRKRAETVARVLVESAVAVIDTAILEGDASPTMVLDELARMHAAYVEPLLAKRDVGPLSVTPSGGRKRMTL